MFNVSAQTSIPRLFSMQEHCRMHEVFKGNMWLQPKVLKLLPNLIPKSTITCELGEAVLQSTGKANGDMVVQCVSTNAHSRPVRTG